MNETCTGTLELGEDGKWTVLTQLIGRVPLNGTIQNKPDKETANGAYVEVVLAGRPPACVVIDYHFV